MSLISRNARRTAVKSRAYVHRLVATLRRKEEGVAAVEFAMIVPVMMLMMIGSIEMSEAVTMDRRVSQVAATSGDLVARFDGAITPDDITEISKIASWLLDKNPATPHKIKVDLSLITVECEPSGPSCTVPSPVPVNYAGQKTRWKCTYDTEVNSGAVSCACANTAFVAPRTGLVDFPASPAVVVSEVRYKYTPRFFDFFMKRTHAGSTGTYEILEKLYNKPRGATIKLNPAGATSGSNTCNI